MAKRKKDVAVEKTGTLTKKKIENYLKEQNLLDRFGFYVNNRYILKGVFALRALRTKYGNDFEDMYEDMSVLKSIHNIIEPIWDSLEPINIGDIIKFTTDTDKRRELFQFFPTRTMFKDAEVVHNTLRITTQEDEFGNKRTIENVYKLVRESTSKILGVSKSEITQGNEYIYAVKVECVTTGKDYYLMVPNNAEFTKPGQYNAAAAIAWTALCPISNPKELIRQGEVMLWVENPNSKLLKDNEKFHLSEEQYFSLLKFQS